MSLVETLLAKMNTLFNSHLISWQVIFKIHVSAKSWEQGLSIDMLYIKIRAQKSCKLSSNRICRSVAHEHQRPQGKKSPYQIFYHSLNRAISTSIIYSFSRSLRICIQVPPNRCISSKNNPLNSRKMAIIREDIHAQPKTIHNNGSLTLLLGHRHSDYVTYDYDAQNGTMHCLAHTES